MIRQQKVGAVLDFQAKPHARPGPWCSLWGCIDTSERGEEDGRDRVLWWMREYRSTGSVKENLQAAGGPQQGTGHEGRGTDVLVNMWALNEIYRKWKPSLQSQNSQSCLIELWFTHNLVQSMKY